MMFGMVYDGPSIKLRKTGKNAAVAGLRKKKRSKRKASAASRRNNR